MYQKIREVALKTGESAELGLVTGPDRDWGPKLGRLLGHKGEPWNWQTRQCLSEPGLGLETRCYLLSRSGMPFASICTFEYDGVGIFGHVYTAPAERKKGAADLLNRQVIGDFQARNGRALYLVTDYNTPPYFIYLRYGFVSVEPESGHMVWTRDGKSSFETDYFAPGPATVEPLTFKHWPTLPALAMMDHPARLRILSMGVTQPRSTEEGVIVLLKEASERNHPPRARVAVSNRTGAPVAFACCGPDRYFGSTVDLLDVFFAPGFQAEALAMVCDLSHCPHRKTVCYTDETWSEKGKVLEAANFHPEAVMRKHLANGSRRLDVTLWAKR